MQAAKHCAQPIGQPRHGNFGMAVKEGDSAKEALSPKKHEAESLRCSRGSAH